MIKRWEREEENTEKKRGEIKTEKKDRKETEKTLKKWLSLTCNSNKKYRNVMCRAQVKHFVIVSEDFVERRFVFRIINEQDCISPAAELFR